MNDTFPENPFNQIIHSTKRNKKRPIEGRKNMSSEEAGETKSESANQIERGQ